MYAMRWNGVNSLRKYKPAPETRPSKMINHPMEGTKAAAKNPPKIYSGNSLCSLKKCYNDVKLLHPGSY